MVALKIPDIKLNSVILDAASFTKAWLPQLCLA